MVAMGGATERAVFAQPEEIERLVEATLDERVLRLGDCLRIWLVGTGSSQHAAELGAAMLREAGLDARPVPAMDFVRFSPPPRPEDGVVVITHTAETAFALSARARATKAGATLLSMTRQGGGWPEAVETVPRESSETYTVSYTATLLVLARMAVALGAPAFGGQIGAVGPAVREALEHPGIEDVEPTRRALVLAGVGPASVTTREGALKVREASRILAEGYDAEYLLHGSAVPLGADDHIALLSPPDDPDGLMAAIGRAAEREGTSVTQIAETVPLHPLLAQIPLTVRLQLLALRFAERRDQNADVAITGAWTEDELWDLGGPGSGPEVP